MDDLYKLYLESIGIHYLPHNGSENTRASSDDLAAPFETLESLLDYMGDCHRCPLGSSRTRLVFGVGNPGADLVFVGEAPGHDEDQTGEPFVGKAGQLLTKIIAAMGLSRDDVYICERIEVQAARQQGSIPGGSVHLQAFSGQAAEYPVTRGNCRTGQFCGPNPSGDRCPDLSAKGQLPRFSRDPSYAHIPPILPPSQLEHEGPRLGRHEKGYGTPWSQSRLRGRLINGQKGLIEV